MTKIHPISPPKNGVKPETARIGNNLAQSAFPDHKNGTGGERIEKKIGAFPIAAPVTTMGPV
jgi:hypothetical protein